MSITILFLFPTAFVTEGTRVKFRIKTASGKRQATNVEKGPPVKQLSKEDKIRALLLPFAAPEPRRI